METEEIKIQINVPDGKKLVGTKVENGVIIPIFKDKEVEPSKTWEEWCKKNPDKGSHYITIRGKSYAESFLALMQLMNLRDEYRQGWKPDWRDDSDKYIITYYKTAITCDIFAHYNRILSFQSADIRDKFLENCRDLIEQAKEFI